MKKLPKGILILPAALFFLLSAPVGAKKPVVLRRAGFYCVILPYDFDREQKDIPDLDLPDNALLLLQGVGGRCEPSVISVEQEGEILPATGWESFYMWGAFRIVYFPPKFDKFSEYKLRFSYEDKKGEVYVGGRDLKYLVGEAEKRGKRPWKDPVTPQVIERAHPLELAELLSRGRYTEYANLALDMMKEGGLPLLRRKARSALMAGDALEAACLASLAVKWAPAYETRESRRVPAFQDWVVAARAFKNMGSPAAAIKAYDEALKLYLDPRIVSERKKNVEEHKSRFESNPGFRPGLTEMELAAGRVGPIPVPKAKRDEIRAGVSANGVYLGNHRERVLAQCGTPDERLSAALLYTAHEICPEAVFVSPANLVYSIVTTKGKTQEGIRAGTDLEEAKKRLGEPEETEPLHDASGRKTGTKWIYTGRKLALLDLDGDGKVDQIEVFDYSLIQ